MVRVIIFMLHGFDCVAKRLTFKTTCNLKITKKNYNLVNKDTCSVNATELFFESERDYIATRR